MHIGHKLDHSKDPAINMAVTLASIAVMPAFPIALLSAKDPALPDVVPLSCFARAWKAEKLFGPSSTAFAAKTMP